MKNFSNVKIVTNTTCFAYFHYNLLLAIQDLEPEKGLTKTHEIRQRIWKIRSSYINLLSEQQKFFRKNCQENLIDYFPIITDQNLDLCITEYLKKRKKLG